jgi:hypothetical protein
MSVRQGLHRLNLPCICSGSVPAWLEGYCDCGLVMLALLQRPHTFYSSVLKQHWAGFNKTGNPAPCTCGGKRSAASSNARSQYWHGMNHAVCSQRACRFGPCFWQHGQALGGGHQAQQVTAAAVPGSLPTVDTSTTGVSRPLSCGGAAITGETCAGRSGNVHCWCNTVVLTAYVYCVQTAPFA